MKICYLSGKQIWAICEEMGFPYSMIEDVIEQCPSGDDLTEEVLREHLTMLLQSPLVQYMIDILEMRSEHLLN